MIKGMKIIKWNPIKDQEGMYECDFCGETIAIEDTVKGYHVKCGGSCEPYPMALEKELEKKV